MAPTRKNTLSYVLTRKHVATQTELPQKHAATQLSGCRDCLNLALAGEGTSEIGCLRCDQVDDLLSLVAELREEVERLRSIREVEREIDWWSQALPSLRQKQGHLTDQSQSERDPVSSPRQAEGSSLKEGSEWKQVHVRHGRQQTFSFSPTSPSHVPLCNRYQALAVEGHLSEDMDDSQATPEVAPRPKRPMPRVVTTPTKKKRRVIVIGDSHLKGTEGPICRADPPFREVLKGLPGACVKDITRKLPSLVQPSDYYPLLLLHVGGDEAETRTTKAIKRDFRLLGQSLKDSGAQVIFSSLLPVKGSNGGWNRRMQSINAWLHGWCQRHNFGFFDNGAAYTAPGLMNPDGIHLSQRGKRIFAQELVGLIDRALN
ncbi:hypothetical protein GRJ2_002923700 [Grus japonensis]|uniref:SGNH hydrolase-type esterase domain-containing protein n=1 Tax=Grus japonensis TaxID=30415 RepID=A0ABC9Y3R7_GRUJA